MAQDKLHNIAYEDCNKGYETYISNADICVQHTDLTCCCCTSSFISTTKSFVLFCYPKGENTYHLART